MDKVFRQFKAKIGLQVKNGSNHNLCFNQSLYLFILDLKSNECHSCMVCIDEFAVGDFSI